MRIDDLTSNQRLPILQEVFASLHRTSDAQEAFETFLGGMRRAYGDRCFVMLNVIGLPPGHYRVARVKTPDNRDLVTPGMLLDPDVNMPVLQGGVFGEVTRQSRPMLIRDLKPSDFPHFGADLGAGRELLAAPVIGRDGVTDWVILIEFAAGRIRAEEPEETLLRANLLSLAIQNVRIVQQLREAGEQIRNEVDRIASIQRSLLPERLPQVPGLTLASSYQTYDRAGGDIYDIRPLNTCGRGFGDPSSSHTAFAAVPRDGISPWALMVADVSGHGPAAAVVMAMLHAILHAYPRIPSGPAEMLTHVNRQLTAKRIEQSFVTAFMAFYHPRDHTLVYANAGHPPALVKDYGYGSNIVQLDRAGELPLGIIDDVAYSEATHQLKSGQTLLLYTDGITEAAGPEGKMFGVEGLGRALANCSGDPECIISTVQGVLRAHEAGKRPNDDQTLLAAQVATPG
ncbi:MAG: SpoIIE family protein phosphatase [Planctomycetes bacterium]|nr:SpoIIE family protein phosphatase [Planctomycetota bacterium]